MVTACKNTQEVINKRSNYELYALYRVDFNGTYLDIARMPQIKYKSKVIVMLLDNTYVEIPNNFLRFHKILNLNNNNIEYISTISLSFGWKLQT